MLLARNCLMPELLSAPTGQPIDRVSGNPSVFARRCRRDGLSPERSDRRIIGTDQHIDPVGHWQLFASPARTSRACDG